MIGYLCGDVLSVYVDRCIVRVAGVGYVVRVSQRFLDNLSCGDQAEAWIEHVMHEGESSLFGFQNEIEQQWFRRLIAVPGVGGRAALHILSALPPNDLCRALKEKCITDLRRAEGVGPRLAERLVTELGKRAEQQDRSLEEQSSVGDSCRDAVMALCQLGYSRMESERAVNSVVKKNPGPDVTFIISQALNFFK